jgi:uncharacterized protein YjbI with pentapeptide repeats
MAILEHLTILKLGIKKWNRWREENSEVIPDLSGANLLHTDLSYANFSNANLSNVSLNNANLSNADLYSADLRHAKLSGANFNWANLSWAILCNADLCGARLISTNLNTADLSHANLSDASLDAADLTDAILSEVNFSNAKAGHTKFGRNDMSTAKGLETVSHTASSMIGIDTLFASSGKIPVAFLRGADVPEALINYLPSLLGTGIEFYSLFISYSTADEKFAEHLYEDLQVKGVRCWFAPHDMRGGKKVNAQIDEAIRVYDRLLLILSPSSMTSNWVETEISKARKREVREKKKVLFPIRLCSFEMLRDWQCFDSDTGKDSAREIREFFIPDFSNWKDNTPYQKAFKELMKDLNKKTEAT